VDVSVQTIRAAERAHADFMIVHHGLWWGRHVPITGTMHARVSGLVRADLSLYAAHLPLDCHPKVGNNVELARLLGLRVKEPFGEYKGTRIGVIATAARPFSLKSFATRVAKTLDTSPRMLAHGPGTVRRVAIVSGGGAMLAEEAARERHPRPAGETSHAAVHPAREAGINVVFGGHYATETVGLAALQRHLTARFATPGVFLAAPTGY
jgi:dinuclear metal center YbgI/SA1388 family protein